MQDRTHDATVTKTGTTIVGLRAAGGAVLAADRRASLGGRFVSNKSAVKIEAVHPTAAVAISGSVGGGQAFARQLRAQADLYEARRGQPMSIDALAQAAGTAYRGTPGQPLLAGVDPDPDPDPDADGPVGHVYTIDGAGGVLEDDYVAGGSGMTIATGVLERAYEADLDLAAAVDAAVAAVDAATERDTASGNGVTVARITDEGVSMDSYAATTEVSP